MNIMLVSVTERRAKLLPQALGATYNNIRLQFIVESMFILLIGGIIGILLGLLLGLYRGYFAESAVTTRFPPSASRFFFNGHRLFFGYSRPTAPRSLTHRSPRYE
jgi:putative ABC transport system permease protein